MANINWHEGFVSAMKLELMADEEFLTFEEEFHIAGGSQRIDLLIIKNESAVKLHRMVGAVFDMFNIYEYKNPSDTLDINTFFKTLAYVCLYLHDRGDFDRYDSSAYTMTLVRDTVPHKLFSQFKRADMYVTKSAPGIYTISGKVPFKTQIIISSELDQEYPWLKALTKKPTFDKLQGVIDHTYDLTPDYKRQADIVMNVFTAANQSYMTKIKEENKTMCEAVNLLFADEISQLKAEMKEEVTKRDKIIDEINKKLEAQISLNANQRSQIEALKKILAEHNLD